MWLDNIGVLSKDSQCFTLDQRANGYARGEGCGVLVIKPLSTALRDGDAIRAVIRSSGSNSNGKSSGLTQPSQEAQYNLIRDTYLKAGLDLASTRFVEAHGTGMILPIVLILEALMLTCAQEHLWATPSNLAP
jgi:acyl transferase domain-containing protein